MTMACDRWREPIADRAAGGPSAPELQAHLGACSACRQALADQQAVHAKIDAELQGMLSVVPSTDLLPRVREQVSRRGAPWALILLPAAAGLALFVFATLRHPADAPPAVRTVEARPEAPPTPPGSGVPRTSARTAASVVRRQAARLPVRRDPPEVAYEAIPLIPDVEPVRPAALVIAPLDALPPIEPRPLVTVGLEFEGADR